MEAYLQAIPQLRVLIAPTGLDELVATLDRCSAQTMVLEAALCTPHLAATLAVLKNASPTLNIVIIADTPGEYQIAVQSGIDRVLMKSNLIQPLDPALFMQQPLH